MEILDDKSIVDDDAQSLNQILTRDYEFRFGAWISEAFELLSANAGWYVLYALITVILSIAVGSIHFAGSIISDLLTPLLTYGFLTFAFKAQQEKALFENFFDTFKDLDQLVIILLINFGIQLIATIPLSFIFGVTLFGEPPFFDPYIAPGSFDVGPEFFGVTFLIGILSMLLIYALSVFLVLAPHFVIFGRLSAVDGIKASFKLVSKHYILAFFFLIVVGILSVIGVLLCGVGILYTLPVATLATYCFYRDAVGLEPIYND